MQAFFESDSIHNISYSFKYTDGRKIRLVNGSGQVNSMRGTVEIFHNNSWGTVCDDGFQQPAATVIYLHFIRNARLNSIRSFE